MRKCAQLTAIAALASLNRYDLSAHQLDNGVNLQRATHLGIPHGSQYKDFAALNWKWKLRYDLLSEGSRRVVILSARKAPWRPPQSLVASKIQYTYLYRYRVEAALDAPMVSTGTRGELAGPDWVEVTVKFIIFKYLILLSALLSPSSDLILFDFRSSVGAVRARLEKQ